MQRVLAWWFVRHGDALGRQGVNAFLKRGKENAARQGEGKKRPKEITLFRRDSRSVHDGNAAAARSCSGGTKAGQDKKSSPQGRKRKEEAHRMKRREGRRNLPGRRGANRANSTVDGEASRGKGGTKKFWRSDVHARESRLEGVATG